MRYLTGATGGITPDVAAACDIGLMLQPGNGYLSLVQTFPYWAADNGCFSQGEAFSLDRFLVWLERVPRARCAFAVAPDVLADAGATLARSLPILPRLRAMGFPAAYVAQNGAERMEMPWADFDVLFLGGTTEWKLSSHAAALTLAARERGKPVHMGRVNSLRRLERARLMGCASADGTFLKFGPKKNLPRLLGWLRQLHEQPCLGFAG